MAINGISTGAGLVGNSTATKIGGNDGVFAGMISEAKQAGMAYEQAVAAPGNNSAAHDDDFITALASLKTNLAIVNRVTQELLGALKEVAHTSV